MIHINPPKKSLHTRIATSSMNKQQLEISRLHLISFTAMHEHLFVHV